MEGVKEHNFEGIKISGFLALFIGAIIAALCIFLTVKDNSYGLIMVFIVPVLQLLMSSNKLKAEPKIERKFLIGGMERKKSKENTFFETPVGMVILFIGFLLLAVIELGIDFRNFLGALGLVVTQPLLLKGLVKLEPNEAVVLTFFGKYRGTLKDNGFFWVNPFLSMKKIPLRLRNMTVNPIKVNDKSGNPIMIGAVLVWRVRDTYKIFFEVDNKTKDVMASAISFVDTQSDAALRKIASMYAYGNQNGEKTLRSVSNEINQSLEVELNSRLALAGLEIVEAKINNLAYSPEIARTMLRSQQADAIVAAREKIVEGAVGIVEKALSRLQGENALKFNDQQKTVMTNNLLAILCTDERVH